MTFIENITRTLTQNGFEHLKDYTIIFPMQRAELYFKEQFKSLLQQSNLHHPIVLPRMLTIDQLVSDLSDLRTADEIRSVCLLYSIYTSAFTEFGSISLDAFYGWGRQLLQDFNSIDMALGNTRSIIANLSSIKALEEANIDESVKQELIQLVNLNYADEHIQTFFHQLWSKLPDIYDTFTQQQSAQGIGTKGQCYRDVIEHFDQLLPRLDGRTMVFVGFNYLLPAERRIMELFHQQHRALFFWDNDPSFLMDKSVYQFIDQNLDQFGDQIPSAPTPSSPPIKPINAIAAQSVNAQVQYVRQWLLDTHHSGQRTAIVITDESVLESVLYALPDSLSQRVNITHGFPLKSTSIYAAVIDFLSDQHNDRLPEEHSYAGVLSRLASYLPVPPETTNTDSATWQQLLQQEAYCQTLMVIHRFMALCEEGVLTAVTELRTMRNLLRRSLEMVTIPFHGEPVEEVQIIGVLETRLLDFDNILILNVEEGVVPARSSDRSFIPFDLRKAYRMQTHDEESKIYAYNFFRLIRRATNVTLIYSEAAGDTSQKTMSRFLMQMLLSPHFNVHKFCLTESSELIDAAPIALDKSWIETRSNNQSALSLSPSALNEYIECPRQFYLSHVLGIRPSEDTTMILNPNELGTFFHGAIQHAYITICGGAVTHPTPVSAASVSAYIAPNVWPANSQDAIQAGFQELIHHYNRYHSPQDGAERYSIDAHKAEIEVIRTMLYNVLKYDSEHCQNMQLVDLEGDYHRRICLSVHGQNITISLGGIIDRLDTITENGITYLRILDYKTGSFREDKLKAASIQNLFANHDAHYVLQTMLYSSVCAQFANRVNPNGYPIMPQLLFTQKLSADKHLIINGQPILDFASCQSEFEAGLSDIITTILSEPLQDQPWKQAKLSDCEKSFCPFHLLCGREKKEW